MNVDLDTFAGRITGEWPIGSQLLFDVFDTDAVTIEAAWKKQFAEWPWIFTDTTAFCQVAAAVVAIVDWLYKMDYPGQTLHYPSLSHDGQSVFGQDFEEAIHQFLWQPDEPPMGMDASDVAWAVETIRFQFDEAGVPFPVAGRETDRSIIEACSRGVVQAIRAMHDEFGPHPLDRDLVIDLLLLCLRSHLGNAPTDVAQAVWPAGTPRSDFLDPATPLGQAAAARGSSDLRVGADIPALLGWDAAKAPIEVLDRALRAKRGDAERVHEARRDLNERARLDGHVLGHLRQLQEIVGTTGITISPDEELLVSAGLDPEPILRATESLRGAGKLRRGGARAQVVAAAEALLRAWGTALEHPRSVLAQRELQRKADRESRKEWYRVWDDGKLDLVFLRDFAPTAYAPGTQRAYLAGSLADGVLGRDDQCVPWFLPVSKSPALVFHPSRQRFADALGDVRTLVASRIAYTNPNELSVVWIDPRGEAASAGPLLRLTEISPHLMDGGVKTTPGEIADALRRIAVRSGEASRQEIVVVVSGFPAAFTPEMGADMISIAESGTQTGVQMIVVIDEDVDAPWLTPETLARFPHVAIIGGPDMQGDIPGWSFVAYRLDGHVARLVYDPPAIRPDEVERIVEGYGRASVASGSGSLV